MKTGPNRKYTAQFRQAAVEQVEAGRSIRAVAKSLEMSPKTLANWLYRSRKGQALVKREPGAAMTDEQAELSRLRAENARLKLERDILKKAAAYFAKESM